MYIIILIIIKNKIPIILHCRWTLVKHPHLILDFFFTNHLTYSELQVYFAHTLLENPTLSAWPVKTFKSYCTIFFLVDF